MSKPENQPPKGPQVDPASIPPIETVELSKSHVFGAKNPNKTKPVKAHDLPPGAVVLETKSTKHWTVRGRVISAAFAWPTAVFCAGAMVRWLLGVFLLPEIMAAMTEVDAGTFQTILFGMGVILGPIFATVGFGIRNKK